MVSISSFQTTTQRPHYVAFWREEGGGSKKEIQVERAKRGKEESDFALTVKYENKLQKSVFSTFDVQD